jgi:hypothetical protein
MYILKSIPDGSPEIRPAPFMQGSKPELDAVVELMEKACRLISSSVADDWLKFRSVCPSSDKAQDFVKSNPSQFHIPFHEILFSSMYFYIIIDSIIFN